jgi:hypothetical protein
MDKINIVDWFDAHNLSHLRAYRNLEQNGFWDFEFVPENVEFTLGWQVVLVAKLANSYLDLALGKT